MNKVFLLLAALLFNSVLFAQLTEAQIKAYNSLPPAEKKKVDDKIMQNLKVRDQQIQAIAREAQKDNVLKMKPLSVDRVDSIATVINKRKKIETLLEWLVYKNKGGNDNEKIENYKLADTFYLAAKNNQYKNEILTASTIEVFYYYKNNYDYARNLRKQNKFQQSMENYLEASEYYLPDSSFFYAAQCGRGLIESGKEMNKSIVLNYYNKAIALDTKNDLFVSERGIFYLSQMKDTALAIADLTKAVQLNPKDAVTFQYLAVIQYYKSNYKEALSNILKSLDIDKYNAKYFALCGIIYQSLKEYQLAIDKFDLAIVREKSNPEYYKLRAECNLLRNNYIDAFDDFGFATMLDPNDENSKKQLKKLDPLLKAGYEKNGFTMQNAFQFFMSRADNQLKVSEGYQKGRAVMNYYKCIQLEPKNPVAYNKAGKLFMEFKMNGPAEQFLRYAAYADGKNPTYFEDLALYYVGLENFKSASGSLDTAILLGTTSVATYDLNGTLKYRLKDYQGSIKSYSKCLAMDPSHYIVKFMRAQAYMQIQNYKAALEDLEAIVKIEPKDQDYQLALKQCKAKLNM